jgi:hypothetical protein
MRWKPGRFLSRILNLNPRVSRLVFNVIHPESGGAVPDFQIRVAAIGCRPGYFQLRSSFRLALGHNP